MSGAPLRVAVAASGGRDSTALLHCTLRSATALGVEVVALHVHHGLMAAADDWLDHVRAQSRRWGVGFLHRRLTDAPAAGDSVEAWARQARYRALAGMAQEAACPLVLLAHHRRDQAETWLLQALRSGGPAGLSAMPAIAQRAGLTWARPWLGMPREAIDAYVRRHRLRHIDDDSNADPRYARNRLRLQVWPALQEAFPQAEVTLAGAARKAQHAAALALEMAAIDLPPLADADALRVAPLLDLPSARRLNALQAWLRQTLQGGVPDSLVERLLDELPGARSAVWATENGDLRLYRGLLRWLVAKPVASARVETANDMVLDLSNVGQIRLAAWGGQLLVDTVASGGVDITLLRDVVARSRKGGERFRAAPNATPRSLKKQFQSHAVPAWQRQAPLLFTADGRLLFVPGLGIDAALRATPGAPQRSLGWLPD